MEEDEEFNEVIKHDDDIVTPLPKEVTVLRDVINDFKNVIIESLTPEDINGSPAKVQDMKIVDMANSKLKNLSNILTAIVSQSPTLISDYNEEDVNKILEVLRVRHFDVKNLEDETRKLCIHYIEEDFKTFDRRYKKDSLD